MEIVTVGNARFDFDSYGWPLCHVDINGFRAGLALEQKFLDYGGVMLEDLPADIEINAFILPADPGNGRIAPQRVENVVIDTRLVRLAYAWLEAMNKDFKPGRIEIPPASTSQ